MSNQLTHELSLEASANFKKIAAPNSDRLFFADIIKYERKGPEQMKVGRFLEDNFEDMQHIASNTSDYDYESISKDDLNLVTLLSSGDQKEIDKKRLDERAKHAVVSAGEASILISPLAALTTIVATSTGVGAAFDIPIFTGILAAGAAGGYALGKWGTDQKYSDGQKLVDAFTP